MQICDLSVNRACTAPLDSRRMLAYLVFTYLLTQTGSSQMGESLSTSPELSSLASALTNRVFFLSQSESKMPSAEQVLSCFSWFRKRQIFLEVYSSSTVQSLKLNPTLRLVSLQPKPNLLLRSRKSFTRILLFAMLSCPALLTFLPRSSSTSVSLLISARHCSSICRLHSPSRLYSCSNFYEGGHLRQVQGSREGIRLSLWRKGWISISSKEQLRSRFALCSRKLVIYGVTSLLPRRVLARLPISCTSFLYSLPVHRSSWLNPNTFTSDSQKLDSLGRSSLSSRMWPSRSFFLKTLNECSLSRHSVTVCRKNLHSIAENSPFLAADSSFSDRFCINYQYKITLSPFRSTRNSLQTLSQPFSSQRMVSSFYTAEARASLATECFLRTKSVLSRSLRTSSAVKRWSLARTHWCLQINQSMMSGGPAAVPHSALDEVVEGVVFGLQDFVDLGDALFDELEPGVLVVEAEDDGLLDPLLVGEQQVDLDELDHLVGGLLQGDEGARALRVEVQHEGLLLGVLEDLDQVGRKLLKLHRVVVLLFEVLETGHRGHVRQVQEQVLVALQLHLHVLHLPLLALLQDGHLQPLFLVGLAPLVLEVYHHRNAHLHAESETVALGRVQLLQSPEVGLVDQQVAHVHSINDHQAPAVCPSPADSGLI